MPNHEGHLTNEEHKELADWADELAVERRGRVPTCPFCFLWNWMQNPDEDPETVYENAPEMKFRHGNIHREPIAWGQNRKCPECYFLIGFGVPMHEDEFEKTKGMMNGRRNYNGKPIEDLREQEVKERLKDLGYLEM